MSEIKPVERQKLPKGYTAEDVRGDCPCCDGVLVCNAYYVHGKGYILAWECVGSIAEPPTCSYRKVL